MPEAAVEIKAPARRGRKTAAPVTKRRHDPKDGPLDGYTRPDLIMNQRKGYVCAMLSDEDFEEKAEQGYRRVERSKNGPRPKWWSGDSSKPGYRRKGLQLCEIRADRHAQLHKFHLDKAADRMAVIHNKIDTRGGQHNSRVETR